MDKEQALHNFYSSFGLTAYGDDSVPDDAELNYITYPVEVGEINSPVFVQPSIWYSGTSWEQISKKAHEIMDGIDGHQIEYDNGSILLFAGNPKYKRVDSGKDNVRRIVLIIQMEFLEI